MDYTVMVSKAICGDVIPLIAVVEAMARHVSTGHGELDLHGPTLKAARSQQSALLLAAAENGELKVCTQSGQVGSVSQILSSDSQAALGNKTALPKAYFLYSKLKHLQDWGNDRGDCFAVKDVGTEVVAFDLTDQHGNVIKKDYFRGMVGRTSTDSVTDAGLQTKNSKQIGKLVTPEQIAYAQDLRDKHGATVAAKMLNVSRSLLSDKTQKKSLRKQAAIWAPLAGTGKSG